jgi:hypothetical protein
VVLASRGRAWAVAQRCWRADRGRAWAAGQRAEAELGGGGAKAELGQRGVEPRPSWAVAVPRPSLGCGATPRPSLGCAVVRRRDAEAELSGGAACWGWRAGAVGAKLASRGGGAEPVLWWSGEPGRRRLGLALVRE